MPAKSLFESAQTAATTFRTFSEGRPELIPTGIAEVDNVIGGLTAGTLFVLAADTGVAKSRMALGACLDFATIYQGEGRAGIVSLEDPEDIVGCRLLAWASGVDSRKIRKKDFTRDEEDQLTAGMGRLRDLDRSGRAPVFSYAVGGADSDVARAVQELAEAGCVLSWLDYLQKLDGGDDRRVQVGRAMRRYQRQCAELGMVAGLLSQFSRRDMSVEPELHHLKESGDIENEARVAVLGWRETDSMFDGRVNFKIAKSAYGGAGRRFQRVTDEAGMLVPPNNRLEF